MQSQTAQTETINAADEKAIRSIPLQMIDAWNEGSGATFAAAFTDDADFVAFEGTHLKGNQEIKSFHQQIFDTVVKGSRLEGDVRFVRLLNPDLAVMHSFARATLPGHDVPSPGRDSMQLFVVVKQDGRWRAEAMINARQLTMEQQFFTDDYDKLPAEAQREVKDLMDSLKHKRRQR
jgi:uncharacterized protein (TIGR02246 family)